MTHLTDVLVDEGVLGHLDVGAQAVALQLRLEHAGRVGLLLGEALVGAPVAQRTPVATVVTEGVSAI